MTPDPRVVLTPVTLREARAFVEQHHRHHGMPQGGLFAVGVSADVVTEAMMAGRESVPRSQIVGVAIVGRPVARMIADGYTAEVTRLCTIGTHNACSILYAAAWRAVRALGYRRLVTYTLPEEGGVSLRAAGWKCIGQAGGGSWSRKDRPRVDTHPTQEKLRWEQTA